MGAIMALGGLMGGAGTIGTIFSAVSTLATIAGGVSSYQESKAAQEQAEMQARAAEVNGRMQAIAVNEELLKTLSRNNAAAAASGLQSSGSVAAAQASAQRKAAQELSVNRFNTEMEKTALTQKANSAGNRATATLTGSLFEAVELGHGSYKKIKGT